MRRAILKVTPSRLRYWKRTALVPVRSRETEEEVQGFEFRDLVAARAVLSLLENGVPLRRIRQSVEILREHVPELDEPLSSLRLWSEGSPRMVVRHGDALIEPDGQMVLDFALDDEEALHGELRPLERHVDPSDPNGTGQAPIHEPVTAVDYFELGCSLDSEPQTYDEALAAYRKAIELEPGFADAQCNMGAVLYNKGGRAAARRCFERCLELETQHVGSALQPRERPRGGRLRRHGARALQGRARRRSALRGSAREPGAPVREDGAPEARARPLAPLPADRTAGHLGRARAPAPRPQPLAPPAARGRVDCAGLSPRSLPMSPSAAPPAPSVDPATAAAFQFSGQDLPWLLRSWAERKPDHPFLIWEPKSGETRQWSYAAFLAEAERVAAGLHARGVAKGDKVMIHAENCPEMVIAWYACALLGAVGVTTNTRSVGAEIQYFSEHVGCVAAITQPQYAALVAEHAKTTQWVAVTTDNSGVAPSAEEAAEAAKHVAFTDLSGDPEAAAGSDPASGRADGPGRHHVHFGDDLASEGGRAHARERDVGGAHRAAQHRFHG